MSVLLNLVYRFIAVSINASRLFCEYRLSDANVYMEVQKTQDGNMILKEKNKIGGLTLFILKSYYKTTVIKTV